MTARLTLHSVAARTAAGLVQGAAALAVWLPASYYTTSRIFSAAKGPIPERNLACGLVAAMVFGIVAAYWRGRWPGQAQARALAVAGLVSAGALWPAFGLEAAAPAALVIACACAWVGLDGPARLRRWMSAHRWTAGAVVLPLLLEGLLQTAAGVVQLAMRHRQPAAAHAEMGVLCIGDSYTFGVGASDADHAWSGVLQARLRAAFPGRKLEVVNAGLPGQNSSILLAHLKERVATLRPQVVIVCCGINNRWNLAGLNLADMPSLSRGEQWRVLARQWALGVRLYRTWILSGVRLQEPLQASAPPPPPPPMHFQAITNSRADPQSAQSQVAQWRMVLKDHPDDATGWAALTAAYFVAGRSQEAVDASERAIELAPQETAVWYARVHGLIDLGSREAALAACEDSLEKGCDPYFYPIIAMPALDFDETRMQAHLDDLRAHRPDLYQRLAWIPADYFSQRRFQDVLRRDLLAMNACCQAAGARLVIHSYPFAGPQNAMLRLAAYEIDCPYVSHVESFLQRLRSVPHEQLYVPDGHCTDEGYAMMADDLLPTVQELLSQARPRAEPARNAADSP